MTLEEAIKLVRLEGYPSSIKLDRVREALAKEPKSAKKTAKIEAEKILREYVSKLYEESAALAEAHQTIEWGPGSTTEYQGWNAAYASLCELEEKEAARKGAPKGPRIYLDTTFEELHARALDATTKTWHDMQRAIEAAVADRADVPPKNLTHACIDLCLRLQAEGDLASADTLTTALADWLSHHRVDRPAGEHAPRWRVAMELVLIEAETLPIELRKPIAHAILENDLTHAGDQVRAYCMQRSDTENEARLDELREGAPTIVNALGNAFIGRY